MLQACLNGGRTRDACARVPLTPAEIAAEAAAAVGAGAHELHIHPRDAEGAESLAPDDIAACLTAVRAAVPGIPVGISTGFWIAPRTGARLDEISAWQMLPDYVSINLDEPDAPQVAALMSARGIGIEAGLASLEEAERFTTEAAFAAPLRVLVEMPDVPEAEALGIAEAVFGHLSRSDMDAPVLLHGMGQSAWPCLRAAAARRLDSRIGLEDVLHGPDGTVAPGNGALVAAAAAIFAAAEPRTA